MRRIVERGAIPLAPYEKLVLRTYCKPTLTASLLMRNSTAPRITHENETNIVYQFKCSDDACQRRNITYIGLTTTKLKRRMQGHRNNGAIHEHYIDTHDRKPQVAELVDNTTVINKETIHNRLKIAEAVSIELRRPNLNVQTKFDLLLPSKRRRQAPDQPVESRESASTTEAQQPLGREGIPVIDAETEPNPTTTESHTRAGGRRELRELPVRNYRE